MLKDIHITDVTQIREEKKRSQTDLLPFKFHLCTRTNLIVLYLMWDLCLYAHKTFDQIVYFQQEEKVHFLKVAVMSLHTSIFHLYSKLSPRNEEFLFQR